MNSRKKGSQGERELAKRLNEMFGTNCRRGQQYCGSNGDADVVGLQGIHIECKRVEALNIDTAIEQATNDAKDGDVPCVMHRKNNKEWLVSVKLDDLIEFSKRVWGMSK